MKTYTPIISPLRSS